MKRFFLLLWMAAGLLSAHVHWVDMDPVNPVINSKTRLTICSGHEFPHSGFALNPKLIHRFFVMGLETDDTVAISLEKRCLSGEYVFRKPGVYRVGFVVKKPQMKSPLYHSHMLVDVGCSGNDIQFAPLSAGLEIVAPAGLFGKKKGDVMVFRVMMDGEPVQTTCQMTVDGRKYSFIKSDNRGELPIPIKRYGKYLITTSFQRVGCSLTFWLNPDKVRN